MSLDQVQSVVVALAVVLACVYGLSLVAKRMRGQLGSQQSDCEILSSTFVGPKERLLLLRVRDKELLIGVGQNHMCRLGEFPVGDATDTKQQLAGPVSSTDAGD